MGSTFSFVFESNQEYSESNQYISNIKHRKESNMYSISYSMKDKTIIDITQSTSKQKNKCSPLYELRVIHIHESHTYDKSSTYNNWNTYRKRPRCSCIDDRRKPDPSGMHGEYKPFRNKINTRQQYNKDTSTHMIQPINLVFSV